MTRVFLDVQSNDEVLTVVACLSGLYPVVVPNFFDNVYVWI
jgi:hypothetical protein